MYEPIAVVRTSPRPTLPGPVCLDLINTSFSPFLPVSVGRMGYASGSFPPCWSHNTHVYIASTSVSAPADEDQHEKPIALSLGLFSRFTQQQWGGSHGTEMVIFDISMTCAVPSDGFD